MHKRFIPSLFHQLSNTANVVGVGQGNKRVRGESTGEDAILVLVRKKYNKSDLSRNNVIPRKIDNKPTDIIEVGDIRLFNERTSMMRPAQPGISLGHHKVSAGTFGAVVKDRSTGELLILSNNHVLANGSDGIDNRSTIGDAILQPGPFDGKNDPTAILGHLYRFAPLYRHVATPQCAIAQLFEVLLNHVVNFVRPHYQVRVLRQDMQANTVDCALAKPTTEEAIASEILGLGTVVGIKEARGGMAIKKSGRSTGITSGFVIATDVTIRVEVGNREYGIFTDQVLASPMSIPGDSGSLILTEDNYAVGLLFAGSEQATMFNRIHNVLDALNIVL